MQICDSYVCSCIDQENERGSKRVLRVENRFSDMQRRSALSGASGSRFLPRRVVHFMCLTEQTILIFMITSNRPFNTLKRSTSSLQILHKTKHETFSRRRYASLPFTEPYETRNWNTSASRAYDARCGNTPSSSWCPANSGDHASFDGDIRPIPDENRSLHVTFSLRSHRSATC